MKSLGFRLEETSAGDGGTSQGWCSSSRNSSGTQVSSRFQFFFHPYNFLPPAHKMTAAHLDTKSTFQAGRRGKVRGKEMQASGGFVFLLGKWQLFQKFNTADFHQHFIGQIQARSSPLVVGDPENMSIYNWIHCSLMNKIGVC